MPAVENVPVGESAADSEPAIGNEQHAEGEPDPTPEATDAAQGIDEDELPGSTHTA